LKFSATTWTNRRIILEPNSEKEKGKREIFERLGINSRLKKGEDMDGTSRKLTFFVQEGRPAWRN
jgi:hypothetical protein